MTVLVGWARDCYYASFHFLCFNQLYLTLENSIYPLHKMISALMTMTKKRPSPIVCHLDKHSQWGPCSWRKKNPSNVNRTSWKKKKKYLSKECFMLKLPCLGLDIHFVKNFCSLFPLSRNPVPRFQQFVPPCSHLGREFSRWE